MAATVQTSLYGVSPPLFSSNERGAHDLDPLAYTLSLDAAVAVVVHIEAWGEGVVLL